MKPTILITEKEYHKGKEVFEACAEFNCLPVSEDEAVLAGEIKRHKARTVIVGVDKYAGALYDAVAGGLIARFGVGYDGIDKSLCQKNNIILTNTPGALDRSVAEHAVWLMGALARKIIPADATMRLGKFSSGPGEEIAGKTLLLVGLGKIAKVVAHIAGLGLGMNVLAFDVLDLKTQAKNLNLTEEEFLKRFSLTCYSTDIESLLGRADFISIHVPSNPSTYHFFDARRLGLCKKDAYLINTARGPIVDECALFDTLTAGRLAGAALDVFENEPYKPLDPKRDLRTLANILLTPHIGANTRQANRRMAELALENCRNFLAGQPDKLTRVW